MEMEQCIGDRASVRPTFTLDSSSSASSSASSHPPQTIDDSSDAENDSVDSEDTKSKTAFVPSESKQRRQMKRKRKSHSSTSEMLGFLKEYGEKREKVEEGKFNRKTMQHVNNEFFGQLLSFIKDKRLLEMQRKMFFTDIKLNVDCYQLIAHFG